MLPTNEEKFRNKIIFPLLLRGQRRGTIQACWEYLWDLRNWFSGRHWSGKKVRNFGKRGPKGRRGKCSSAYRQGIWPGGSPSPHTYYAQMGKWRTNSVRLGDETGWYGRDKGYSPEGKGTYLVTIRPRRHQGIKIRELFFLYPFWWGAH